MPTYRLSARSGGRFDLARWVGSGGVAYNISVEAGKVVAPGSGYGPPPPAP